MSDNFFNLFFAALVMSITPGPNNTILAAAGANFGLKATLPAAAGVVAGFTLLSFTIAFGFGQVIQSLPFLISTVKVVGTLFLIYLAWKISDIQKIIFRKKGDFAGKKNKKEKKSLKAPSFLTMVLFQWINPKGIVAVISLSALYLNDNSISAILWFVLGLCGGSPFSALVWSLFGDRLKILLANDKRKMLFNMSMAAVLFVFSLTLFFGS